MEGLKAISDEIRITIFGADEPMEGNTFGVDESLRNSYDLIAEALERSIVSESASKSEESGTKSRSLRFKWMNSVVVDAVRSGDWVVLENVHFCRSAIGFRNYFSSF